VRHCVPSLSLALPTSISCLHLTLKCLSLSLSLFVLISQSLNHQEDGKTPEQVAKTPAIARLIRDRGACHSR